MRSAPARKPRTPSSLAATPTHSPPRLARLGRRRLVVERPRRAAVEAALSSDAGSDVEPAQHAVEQLDDDLRDHVANAGGWLDQAAGSLHSNMPRFDRLPAVLPELWPNL